MCIKKIFTNFTLQEYLSVVLNKLYNKLVKKYPNLDDTFIANANNIYFETELKHFSLNQEMLEFLKSEKNNGKKIFLVSDFNCRSGILKKWFSELKIIDIFDDIYSSSDFDKEKATTKLYRYLIKKLDIKPQDIIMFGDNVWSDVMMAKLCGLKAQRIKTNR